LPESAATSPVTVIQVPLNCGLGAPMGLGIVEQSHLAIAPEGDIYLSDQSAGDSALRANPPTKKKVARTGRSEQYE
jgi:hypothetical protein